MSDSFAYDAFVSHSTKDRKVALALARRLAGDGLRVWLEAWEIKAGEAARARIEDGLERSRVLILSMSADAAGAEWAGLEAGTFRFRDPLNQERRLLVLRLDDAPIPAPLAQFSAIDWRQADREAGYASLLQACRPAARQPAAGRLLPRRATKLSAGEALECFAFSLNGQRALSGGENGLMQLWDLGTGRRVRTFEGHTRTVWSIAFSADQRRALSCGSYDKTIRLWDIETGRCLRVLEGHPGAPRNVAWGADQRHALSCAYDKTMRLWDVETGTCLRVYSGHTNDLFSVAWSADQRRALSASQDHTLRLWDVQSGACLRVFEGHTGFAYCVAWSADDRQALSGASDKTLRLWDVETGQCLRVFEGHTDSVMHLAWHTDQRLVISGSVDSTVRLWDVDSGRCLHVVDSHATRIEGLAWKDDQRTALSGDRNGVVESHDLSAFIEGGTDLDDVDPALPTAADQVQYTNAKVLMVGESGAGKTGLAKRLAMDAWQPSDSTVGAWATQWKLAVDPESGIEREIWLWDFGGQADQRLIHQLYMDETALAVLVFDGQKENLFETLGQWDRDLGRASRQPFAKLLVAGRVDAGGLRVSRGQVEAFREERGYLRLMETSAKENLGCEELKQAILDGIRWDEIPWRSSPLLFKRLKEEIVRLKDSGQALMRFKELRETLQLRLPGDGGRFTDQELKAVVTLLAGPGVVWELGFGSWVLLQPERINAYAQAVIQTMRADEFERGCLPEERVLRGDLTYPSALARLAADEERLVLLAMHQTLVERGLCLREHTEQGALLVFPSYYRRERPELAGHPAVLVSYRFDGFLDEVYATLVVRLHHTRPFQQHQLWRYAADFKTLTGKQLGVKLVRRAEGAAELEVYFDFTIPVEEKIIFSKYIHEHLLQSASDVVRLRHYICPHCGTAVGNREVAMERLETWLGQRSAAHGPGGKAAPRTAKAESPSIVCARCEKRVPLWDELEQCFASPETQETVRALQQQSAIVLDSESKERALVGEVVSAVALAGQICREKSVSDHGIDMEVEFKDDDYEATGEMVLLQLKSGDSYLHRRQRDGAEIFRIPDERHVRYWMAQKFPVMLVIRGSSGEIRWMDVRERLRRESEDGKRQVRQVVFDGERFDVMSVRGWRDRALLERQQRPG